MTSSSRVAPGRAGPATLGSRVEPVQQRSSDRRDRILDAAAGLSDEVGVEQVTTAAIAARAEVSIGTVYRFFTDRIAVFRALTARHYQAYIAQLDSALRDASAGASTAGPTGSVAAELDLLIDVTVDTYVTMLRDVPGFRGFGDAIDSQLLDHELGASGPSLRDNDTVLADRLVDLLVSRTGVKAGTQVRRAVLVAVTTADAVLSLAFRVAPTGDAAVIADAKALLRGYLMDRLVP